MKKSSLNFLCIIIAFSLVINLFKATAKVNDSTFTAQSTTTQAAEKHIRIMSYNVLSDSIGYDGINASLRSEYFKDILEFTSPHILALQEASFNWQRLINSGQFQLKSVCPVRYRLSMSMTLLLYNPSKLTLLNSGIQAFSYAHDTRLRSFTWGLFRLNSTNKRFFVINTHLSLYEKNPYIPLNQAVELINFVNGLRNKYNYPVILTGDFNSKEREAGYESCGVYEYISLYMNNCKNETQLLFSGDAKDVHSAINDYIFATDDLYIESYTLLSDSDLKVISDHYPIYTDILIS